jgi:phospholipid/cholesterol/gamma-HCH transport system substrate-binding protein
MKQRTVDVCVGFFMIFGLLALLMLVMRVSGLSTLMSSNNDYQVTADFMNIGGLKVRSPVTISGVKVGEVTAISLQPGVLNAKVTMRLNARTRIPYDGVSARILTEGLLGSNYVSIVPGFEGEEGDSHPYLSSGDTIVKTQEAIVLENLIGQLLFNINKK